MPTNEPAPSASEEVAAALVSKAAYDAVWEQNALLLKDNDYWRIQAADVLLDLHATQAQLDAARPIVELARGSYNANCDCAGCQRTAALFAAYDALRGGAE